MGTFDYWDLEEALAEQQEVAVVASHDVKGGGLLYASGEGRLNRDLKAADKVQVPFWLAQSLARRHMVELQLPDIYGSCQQEMLQRDPIVCRLCDKSSYYFEIGMRVAYLLEDQALADDLLEGQLRRWREIVKMLGNLGVARMQTHPLNPGASIFPRTLTAAEHAMWLGGQAAEAAYKEWTDKFSAIKMKASHLADVPVAKRARAGGM
mmetsp:Transcript_92196/g.240313  ORF Transcript_92196/g.240313 Transcript_92196/m.240313 type:complete len:208 (+) Transcript_92196:72-695(+)